MPRGPTTKWPLCQSSLSISYIHVPRSGKVESTDVYVCRDYGAIAKRGVELKKPLLA